MSQLELLGYKFHHQVIQGNDWNGRLRKDGWPAEIQRGVHDGRRTDPKQEINAVLHRRKCSAFRENRWASWKTCLRKWGAGWQRLRGRNYCHYDPPFLKYTPSGIFSSSWKNWNMKVRYYIWLECTSKYLACRQREHRSKGRPRRALPWPEVRTLFQGSP